MKTKIKIAFAHSNISHNTEGLIDGISEYIRSKGDWQLIIWPDSSQKSLDFLKKRGCKGAFVSIPTAAKAKELLDTNLPAIALSTIQNVSALPFVSADSKSVSYMAAEYLLKRKFINFAFYGLAQAKWSCDRLEHFSNYLAKEKYKVDSFKEKQIPVINDFVPLAKLWIDTALDTGQENLINWLRQLPKPAAIFASCDIFACHLINAAQEANINIPDEISVLGVNNDESLCNICDPPLSSVALNFKKAGYNAAKLLDKLISGRDKMQGQCVEIQPTHVETRGSTDVFAIDDPEIVQAMRYIKQNSNKPLQVNEIANHVCISKRSLQLKFHKTMGRSIHEEIIQSHFNTAKILLVETNLPIDEVAVRSGFHYTSNMRRAFKNIAGILPQKYRQQHQSH
ncbi:MAG: DNA-binding transcriptional regulator [Phycisphaerae bacterium]|nr:DNA-binding transcriptional regulator [Phycisphaerae bacterium]